MTSSSGKKNSLQAQLDRRFLQLARQYVAQLAPETAASPRPRLDSEAILQFVLRTDMSLRRRPHRSLRQSCDYAVSLLRQEAEEASEKSDGESIDSSCFALDPDVQLVDAPDLNHMNRSLLGVYQRQNANQAGATDQPTGQKLPDQSQELQGEPEKISANQQGEIENNDQEQQPPQQQNGSRTKQRADVSDQRKRRARNSNAAPTDAKRSKVVAADTKWPIPSARLSDLGGIDTILDDLMQLVCMPLRHPEVYRHLGISPPRGVLLHGPPGCGKTLLANAVGGEAGVPFISIAAPVVVSGMSGESEKKIREVFEEARELAPCIVFIDEIDAITPRRETAQREMERRIVAQLLTCMDDVSLEKTDYRPVIVIGATNRPDSLDPALRRAGRFDREIAVGVPDDAARQRILEKLALRLRLEGGFDFCSLSKLTPGYVGADLSALTSEAGIVAIKRILHTKLVPKSMDVDAMSADEETSGTLATTAAIDGVGHLSLNAAPSMAVSVKQVDPTPSLRSGIAEFLFNHSESLTEDELEPLCITFGDFLEALKRVQPSAKREGFATVPDTTWGDIGALSAVREELRMAVVEPVRHPELFAHVGITSPMGVLLYGPPGCGKTLLAKAVASESHCNFISVKGPELLNKYVGESERAVRTVFARAQASSPCVIFFDEIDALCPSRSGESESQSSSRVVNALLTEMDGMQGRSHVFVIAATNRPDMIDPAMLRPGRLDKALYVDLPNATERYEILQTVSRKTPLAPSVDLQRIAEDPRSDGFSGADLASLVREAAVAALRRAVYSVGDFENLSFISLGTALLVGNEHFEAAFAKIVPSVNKKDRKRYELLKVKFGSSVDRPAEAENGVVAA